MAHPARGRYVHYVLYNEFFVGINIFANVFDCCYIFKTHRAGGNGVQGRRCAVLLAQSFFRAGGFAT